MSITTLRAQPTDTLLHAEGTAGHFNVIKAFDTLMDEAGNTLVDEAGNTLISDWYDFSVVILHAKPTTMLLHAEAS